MKKILLIIGIIVITSISVNKANALQKIQNSIDGDVCGLKTCPGGYTQCCTDKAGTTWYNKN